MSVVTPDLQARIEKYEVALAEMKIKLQPVLGLAADSPSLESTAVSALAATGVFDPRPAGRRTSTVAAAAADDDVDMQVSDSGGSGKKKSGGRGKRVRKRAKVEQTGGTKKKKYPIVPFEPYSAADLLAIQDTSDSELHKYSGQSDTLKKFQWEEDISYLAKLATQRGGDASKVCWEAVNVVSSHTPLFIPPMHARN
jgi:hypothetical protein